MKKVIKDEVYNYFYCFDTSTGLYFRSNIVKNGTMTSEEPFMGNYPHLIDVGIKGSCVLGQLRICQKSGIQCYQNGSNVIKPDMRLEDFERICFESKDKSVQFALGGRGDPDTHNRFKEILECSNRYEITPNFTTSGYFIDDKKATLCKKHCGAVAISWHNADYTYKAISALLKNDVKTNIHFVLSSQSIENAIDLLENHGFPKGINAVIFLLHKPSGSGTDNLTLKKDNRLIERFFSIVNNTSLKIGFDSCSVPAILTHMDANLTTIDACEAARFSCYIDSQLNMTPCSFDEKMIYSESLVNSSIEEIWNGSTFNYFRNRIRNSCPKCDKKKMCLGGCQLFDSIKLCYE